MDGILMDRVLVVAAVVERRGRLLITRRRPGSDLADLWEFPGGKPEAGETLEEALRREIREELGAEIEVGQHLETVEWDYPTRHVRLVFFRCAMDGDPRPLEGQEMRWVTSDELETYAFPAADATLINRLRGR